MPLAWDPPHRRQAKPLNLFAKSLKIGEKSIEFLLKLFFDQEKQKEPYAREDTNKNYRQCHEIFWQDGAQSRQGGEVREAGIQSGGKVICQSFGDGRHV